MQKTYSNRHVPVLAEEVKNYFKPLTNLYDDSRSILILDGTLGAGGHSLFLLQHYPQFKVIGLDQDENTLLNTKQAILNDYPELKERICFTNAEFSRFIESIKLGDGATQKLAKEFAAPWQGVLLDLGYSSNQLESPEYGMSFQVDGPLDMQLERKAGVQNKLTAWNVLTETNDQELADIFRVYADIPMAMKFARKIHAGLQKGEIQNSTLSLANFIASKFGNNKKQIHPATLVFQALRIAVNDELRKLDKFLNNIMGFLDASAVLQIITFHSIEDRLVKLWAKNNNSIVSSATKKPIIATETEMKENPRSRSAKLRVLIKNAN